MGDSTRLRLLSLLEREELTVAELARITRLAQPRVSTHLARLREADLVVDRRDGVSVFYRIREGTSQEPLLALWRLLKEKLDDALIESDREHLAEVLALRKDGDSWPDIVAGDMERHYSPGRPWEATTRALVQLLTLGRVLDIASGDGVIAELLAGRSERIDCLDLSPKVVRAGSDRVAALEHVHFHQGDMHALPFEDGSFDTVLLLHALTYSEAPAQVLAECARVLKPRGQLLAATLVRHRYTQEVRTYGHVNNGFTLKQLKSLVESAGLSIRFCENTSIERKTPNFRIITLLAQSQ
ncbi:MAG: metalloregulator ArsR/SmtB family transcription factor [Wenzhouxiangella sp.]|nr:metalloregulator ArsR/SmtB family transcription factor [Wenzhouxiangella sp.]